MLMTTWPNVVSQASDKPSQNRGQPASAPPALPLPTGSRSRKMRDREQKVMVFMLWWIVSVTDLTAAMWDAAGSGIHWHCGTVTHSTLSLGFFHAPFLPSIETLLEWYSVCDFKIAKISWWTLPHLQCHQKTQGRHPESSLVPQDLHSCLLRAFIITV